jgi:hypothetical protein
MGFFSNLFKSKPEKVKERTATTMQVGDVVTYMGDDYIISGKISYFEEGDRWFDYCLDNNGDIKWLSAEDDGMISLVLYSDIKLKVSDPVPSEIEYQGIEFEIDEKGHAKATVEGETGRKKGLKVKYWDYCDDEDKNFLSIEKWGGHESLDVSFGHSIDFEDLTVYPGERAGENRNPQNRRRR